MIMEREFKPNKNGKLVAGVGINDVDYKVKRRWYDKVTGINTWECPYFKRWVKVLTRCYSEKYQEKHPAYKGCSVCEEWLTFSNFKRWMEKQDWEGKQLDKDILHKGGVKVYSPETCCFVSSMVNNFMLTRSNDRGEHPLGVSRGRTSVSYSAQCGCDGVQVQLGSYKDALIAHRAWQKTKIAHGRDLINRQDDDRVIEGLTIVVDRIERSYNLREETLTL